MRGAGQQLRGRFELECMVAPAMSLRRGSISQTAAKVEEQRNQTPDACLCPQILNNYALQKISNVTGVSQMRQHSLSSSAINPTGWGELSHSSPSSITRPCSIHVPYKLILLRGHSNNNIPSSRLTCAVKFPTSSGVGGFASINACTAS